VRAPPAPALPRPLPGRDLPAGRRRLAALEHRAARDAVPARDLGEGDDQGLHPRDRRGEVGGTANPRLAPRYLAEIGAAAEAAGRQPDEVGLAVGCVSVVDRDGRAARTVARRKAALYLGVIADLDPTLDLEPDRLARIRAAAAAYDFETAAREIPDAVLSRVALAGTPDEVAMQADALYAAGVQRVEFGTPHGLSESEGLRLLGESVLPARRVKWGVGRR
jgi:5,10-methylenetetrahydromethanopterin reductase